MSIRYGNRNYDHNTEKPPLSPAVKHGVRAINAFTLPEYDTARYLLDPDDDFPRPYLLVPGWRAFIWPLGVEGFEIQDQATLGRHKYLGEIELDVDVTHKGETGITLSGIFPGHTSVANMQALRQVFSVDTPERGKVLHLPGILPNLQYVVGETFTYTHAEDERSQDIAYSCSFVKVGTGPKAKAAAPAGNTARTTKKFVSNSRYNTLRKIATRLKMSWTNLYAVKANAAWFDKRNISSHRAPDYRLPNGTVIYYV